MIRLAIRELVQFKVRLYHCDLKSVRLTSLLACLEKSQYQEEKCQKQVNSGDFRLYDSDDHNEE
jgi:hypothetical protein